MKKLSLLIIAASLLTISCDSDTDGYVINVHLADLTGDKLVLYKRTGGEMVAIDSVVLDDAGKGILKGGVEGPEMMYLVPESTDARISLFMDNAVYEISGSADDPEVESDGGAQQEWNAYREGTSEYTEALKQIMMEYQQAAGSGAGEEVIDSLRDAYYEVNARVEAYDSVYKSENSGSIVSLFLLRGSFHSLDNDELEQALEPFRGELDSSPYFEYLSEHLQTRRRVEIGQKYVDFELPDTAGNPVRLSDLAGEGVLLIDFWASWCGPCRRANPGVVEIYNEFSEKGFDIVGVSLDRTREDWMKGIYEDGLTWTHVSDLKFWDSEAGKLYAVSSIPHTVLLDKDGTIIARNLEKEELKAKLNELLGS